MPTPGSSIHRYEKTLLARIRSRTACVGVIGLGYVGLPLTRAMHDAGFRVIGFDIDQRKVLALRAGRPYLKHLGRALYHALAHSSRFTPTSRAALLAECDAVAICVPTPLGRRDEPDLTYVQRSSDMVARVVRPGTLVTLVSTTYPGTTREVVLPLLERHGHALGRDIFVAFSPEREDPGRPGVETRTIPRLVGGLDAPSTRVAHALFAAAIKRVIPVRSAEVAESAKLLENIYRAVNIALVNELKPVLMDMGIDIWEVIDAAATKPFGFQAFYPGPGWGGHCIPVDPYYLTWKARQTGHKTRFIELAGRVNRQMPAFVVSRLAGALREQKRTLRGAKVLILGIAYKKNIDDVRETPAAEIIRILHRRGASVSYHDPHVPVFPSMRRYRFALRSVRLTRGALRDADAVVIVTDHDAIDYNLVAHHARLIVDTRNALAHVRNPSARVVQA
jgi:UDP-N-acetyl-D-glucosamine dehydrogenase